MERGSVGVREGGRESAGMEMEATEEEAESVKAFGDAKVFTPMREGVGEGGREEGAVGVVGVEVVRPE